VVAGFFSKIARLTGAIKENRLKRQRKGAENDS